MELIYDKDAMNILLLIQLSYSPEKVFPLLLSFLCCHFDLDRFPVFCWVNWFLGHMVTNISDLRCSQTRERNLIHLGLHWTLPPSFNCGMKRVGFPQAFNHASLNQTKYFIKLQLNLIILNEINSDISRWYR